jgi:23S rRNA pseudouridine2605 synthase
VKTYSVKVRGVPEERLVDKLRRGITIDGKRTLPCDIERMHTTGKRDDEGNSWFEVKLREGRTQQIRKMFQAVGHPVSKLRRVAIGPISDPKLTPGVWRELTKQEVKMLETMKEPKKTVKPRRTTARPTSRKKPAAAASRKPAAPRAKTAAKRSVRTETRSSTRRTPSPRPATPRPKVAAGKSSGSKKPAVRRAGARPSRSSARR